MKIHKYRIRTDGDCFICELQKEDDSWGRVAFQDGEVHEATSFNTLGHNLAGELFDSEKELLSIIESVLGTSARRVREWRTV